MGFGRNHLKNDTAQPGWRQYQTQLKRQAVRRRLKKHLPLGVVLILLLAVGGGLLFAVSTDIAAFWDAELAVVKDSASKRAEVNGDEISKTRIPEILTGDGLQHLTDNEFSIDWGGRPLQVATTIDPSLQAFILNSLNKKHTPQIGIVALEPHTGRILAMISHNRADESLNICLDQTFPAASIFKIVTAAAAIETQRMDERSKLYYNGRRHTLYKSQLKDNRNRYTRQTTLRESFAQSINPVFGKLGANLLGGETLRRYARVFGFNQPIKFDLPMPASHFSASEKHYEWAEMASGFNRKTQLSPLHGAMIAAALLNKGLMMEPAIVDTIADGDRKILYHHQPAAMKQTIAADTTATLMNLMTATIEIGTARKAFRGHGRDPILKRLRVGGKTGSINVDPRFEWFVGFGAEKSGSERLALAVFVAHDKYIGTRPSQYARVIFTQYFKSAFARRINTQSPSSG